MLVLLHLAAQFGEAAGQLLADGFFLAGRAVDSDQVKEGFNDAGFVDQGDTRIQLIGYSITRGGGTSNARGMYSDRYALA